MKTMLITGASRGIGAATAILAAQHGYAVAVNYRNSRVAAQEVVAQIREGGGEAVAIQGDVSREKEIVRLFSEVDDRLGRLDCLVNNAGTLERQMPLAGVGYDRLQRMFQTNVLGPVRCCQEAIKRMARSAGGRGGTIVNVSSIASRTGSPFEYVDYAMTKGALDALTIGLSKELAGEDIRVNAVRPAFIHTEIHAAGGEPGRIDRLKERIPLKRGGRAEEVAEAILWLASGKSSYSTGIFLDVAGGA